MKTSARSEGETGRRSKAGAVIRAARLACALLLVLGAHAERYLTPDQALKLCFPGADAFVARTARLTADQVRSIEDRAGVKVESRSQRYWIARAGTNVLGAMVLDFVMAKHELVDYVVAIGPAGRVLQVEILEFRESHGGEVRGAKWLAQFRGKNSGARLAIHEDIYNLSGATISCRNVTQGVKRVLATFDFVLRPGLLDAGGVPADSVATRADGVRAP